MDLQLKFSILFLSYFNETQFFLQVFKTYSNIKFHENLSSGSQTVPSGQTDRHDKADGHFSLFCKQA